ncbi:Leucine-rich repeat-containing protein 56 [Pleodorina starrii]|nr:Leucine-rich repeat-containing protein 56 [Pleodorina starrii]
MEPTIINTALAEALAAQYPSMLSLDLRSNNIVSIQDLQPLSGLRELALDDNQLQTLDGLADLGLLTSLSAQRNLITDLGDRVTALTSLRVLNLAWNQLAAGPWVHRLARLPQLTELDLRGNPVCELFEGSEQMLAAALPHLQRLNGVSLRPLATQAQTGSGAQRQPGGQAGAGASGRGLGPGPDGQLLAGDWFDPQSGIGSPAGHPTGDAGGGDNGLSSIYQPINARDGLPREPISIQPWPLQLVQVSPQTLRQQQRRQDEVWPAGSAGEAWWSARDGPQRGFGGTEQLSPRLQLAAATRAHGALAAAHATVLEEREALAQRTAFLEEALRQAEEAKGRLQQQLQQQSTSSAQQVAGLAAQVASLLAERDAAVRQVDLLKSQLADAEARVDEAAQAAGGAAQQAEQLLAMKRQLQQELAATQEMLLRSAATAQGQAQPLAVAGVAPGASGQARSSPGSSPVLRGGVSGGGGFRLEAALQQRVDALQHVVRMQERELVRLGDLSAGRPSGIAAGSPAGSTSPSSAAGWDNVLRPWREQVQELHEQIGRLVAEGVEKRTEWGLQMGELREQFTQARTLLEVLERRSREHRSENAQLQAQIAQLVTELHEERQRAAGVQQQLASRDGAAQAVRRQLLAFKSHMEQREAALEGRAEQLSAHAARLSYASKRLTFALSLAAVRGQGGRWPASASGGRQEASGPAAQLCARPCANTCQHGSSHLALPGGAGAGAGGAAAQADEGPVVEALRQELSRLARDREMLLEQLAQVAMQDRESRRVETLVASRVQALEAEANRKVQAAEAAAMTQAAQVRQQVVAALEAAEELCRRVEAAAGLRLSKMSVRLSDLAQQVGRFRSARHRGAQELRAAGAELERLRVDMTSALATEADLRRQLSSRDREAHARLAELRAKHEEELTAERRRVAEAERLFAKASAECGQLERQLARTREVRAQQDDARFHRLQSQVHEQEVHLRTLRRERNTLLAELRKLQCQGPRSPVIAGDLLVTRADAVKDTAAVGDTGEASDGGGPRIRAAPDVALGSAGPGPTRLGSVAGAAVVAVLQRGPGPRAVGVPAVGGGASGSSIRSILRGGVSCGGLAVTAAGGDRTAELDGDRVVAAPRGSRAPSLVEWVGGGAACGVSPRAQSAAVAGMLPVDGLAGTSDCCLERLAELEVLTAELLSLE